MRPFENLRAEEVANLTEDEIELYAESNDITMIREEIALCKRNLRRMGL